MNSRAQICVKWNRLSAEDLGLLLRRESDVRNTKIFAIYPRLYFSWLAKGVRKARMPSGFVVIIGVYLLLSFFIIIIIILLEMGLSSCTCLEFRIICSLSEKKAAFYPRRWTDISRAPTSWFGAEKRAGIFRNAEDFLAGNTFFFFFGGGRLVTHFSPNDESEWLSPLTEWRTSVKSRKLGTVHHCQNIAVALSTFPS